MNLWKVIKDSRLIVKVGMVTVILMVTAGLLLLPILTVDAGETASRTAEHPGLAFMARQDATGGIVLLSSALVLIIVGGALRVINQDRIHRPHLLKPNGKEGKEED